MLWKKFEKFLKSLESTEDRLLGPNLKLLQVTLLRLTGNKIQRFGLIFMVVYQCTFIITQLIDSWMIKHDIYKLLENFSIIIEEWICLVKVLSLVILQEGWMKLAREIAFEESHELQRKDIGSEKITKEYTKYSRSVTYLYCICMFSTSTLMLFMTFVSIISSTMPKTLLFSSWVPFDNTESPGYYIALFTQIPILVQGTFMVISIDTYAIAIMVFLKGHLKILRHKCRRMFDEDNLDVVMDRVKECYRHHTHLIQIKEMLDSLLSPIMFMYVLICPVMMCCCIVQINVEGTTSMQHIWIVMFFTALTAQLFVYCWHGNEVLFMSNKVEDGIYESKWWRGNVRLRRIVLLLGGQMRNSFVLNAGPFTTLTVETFITILKGSYSYYAILSKNGD